MNPSPDAPPPSLGVTPRGNQPPVPEPAPDWQAALDALMTSRVGLFKLESKDAVARASHKLMFLGAAAIAIVFAWGFLVTGVIQAISTYNNWPLYWIVLGAGFGHLLVALFCAILAKSSGSPSFSVTRAELQKDREWLHQLLKTKKSND